MWGENGDWFWDDARALGSAPKVLGSHWTDAAYGGDAKAPSKCEPDAFAAKFPNGNLQRGAAPASAHYAALTPEPIDVIEGWNLNYRIGCAIKYLARAGKKDPTKTAEDYEKAMAYIRREINGLRGKPAW